MNTIKLKSATLKDINFLVKLYNDQSIQNNSLNTDSFEVTNKEVISTLKYFYSNNLEYYIIYSGNIKIGIALIYEVNIISENLNLDFIENGWDSAGLKLISINNLNFPKTNILQKALDKIHSI